jgi:glycosyltransferase involved in cell wall biosynthesis
MIFVGSGNEKSTPSSNPLRIMPNRPLCQPSSPQKDEVAYSYRVSPLVSIGLPVFNGAQYLDLAIQSILAQTYRNLELIINDNASTDQTQAICLSYAERDARVSYQRNYINIGGANNENLVFSRAKGKYFKWAAHDDVLETSFIQKCVDVLEQNCGVVLVKTHFVIIDEAGAKIGIDCDNRASSNSAFKRFSGLTLPDHGCRDICGLMRSEIVGKMKLRRNYTDSDRTFLSHMSLFGTFHQIGEPLFYKRTHPETSINQYPGWHERMVWFGEEYKTKIALPHWLQELHYFESIAASPLKAIDKLLCYMYMLHRLFIQGHCRGLAKDLLVAARRLYGRVLRWILNKRCAFCL